MADRSGTRPIRRDTHYTNITNQAVDVGLNNECLYYVVRDMAHDSCHGPRRGKNQTQQHHVDLTQKSGSSISSWYAFFLVRRLSHLRTVRYPRTHYSLSLSVPHYTSTANGRIVCKFSLACYRLCQVARRSHKHPVYWHALLIIINFQLEYIQFICARATITPLEWITVLHTTRHLAAFRNCPKFWTKFANANKKRA